MRACAPSRRRCARNGIYRGIGFASFIEVTNPSAAFYGVGGARISSQDGATVKLDAQGTLTDPLRGYRTGSGHRSGAGAVRRVLVRHFDGQGARRHRRHRQYALWRRHLASRAAGIGGEAAWQAGKALRDNVLAVAGAMLQAKPEDLDIRNGIVVDKITGTERLGLDELARVAYFRPDTLPPGFHPYIIKDLNILYNLKISNLLYKEIA